MPSYTQIYPPEIGDTERYETDDVKIFERKDFISVIEEVSREFNTPFTVRSRFIGADYDGKGNIYYSRPIASITYFQTAYKKQSQKEFMDHGSKVTVINEPLKKITDEEYQGAPRSRSIFESSEETVKGDLEITTNVRLKEVEEAQQRIVNLIRKLEDAGEVIINKGGDDDNIVV